MRGPRALRALALLAVAACAGQPTPPPEDELEGKPWDVQRSLLPPYPKESDLLRVYVGNVKPFAYFVDRASISVRQDEIVRYALVARSASGARNVSYEGLRCRTYESRIYAFGRDDGTWVQARNRQWNPYNRYESDEHLVLADDFFCTERGTKPAEEIVRALLRGNGPR